MKENDFARTIFLIIAVIAVIGLLSTGSLDITGFASKKKKSGGHATASAGSGSPPGKRAGEQCVRNSECQAGLVCRGGRVGTAYEHPYVCGSPGGPNLSCDEDADCLAAYRPCANHACTSR